MVVNSKILVGKDTNTNEEFYLLPNMANRHGVIAGASGSGKTITLKVLAESFSDLGTPVFLADVKGDLAGMCQEGIDSEDMQKRINKFSLNDYGFSYKSFPTEIYDVSREKGLPVRTTISDFGPVLLSHVLELNQVQSDILNVVFKIADDEGLLLLDVKDLKKMIEYVIENSSMFSKEYGNLSKVSLQTIQRSLLSIEQSGFANLFGEPMLNISDFLKTNNVGQGFINVLHSESIITSPRIYGAFMLWLLSELYEQMPEVGDLDKPKIVFFFDEAHLLFKNASKVLLDKITQVTKLIRSKGIGLYFISQSPTDIPDAVLSQLGNKIQHVHRAYSANDRKNLKAIVAGFRTNKDIDLEEIIESLGTGEAVVSLLDEKGAPSIVKFAKILPPQSKMGTIDDTTRDKVIKGSLLYNKYFNEVDRESAYEILFNRANSLNNTDVSNIPNTPNVQNEIEINNSIPIDNSNVTRTSRKTTTTKVKKSALSKATTSVARTTGSSVGREIGRALAKSIFGNNSTMAKNIAGNLGSSIGRNILGNISNFF